MRGLHYCKKCGRIVLNSENLDPHRCDYCHSVTYPVPEKYWVDGRPSLMNKERKQLLREELVKTSPEFDEDLFNGREEYVVNQAAEWDRINAALDHGKAIMEGRDKGNRFGIECPYCHATNVRKVSFAGRAVSAGLFGLGSSKIGKQWHCNRCGSDF